MNIGSVTKIGVKLEKFTKDNAPTILTGVGVVGTLATAFLTGKATFKAADLINEKKFIKHLHEPATTVVKKNDEELTKFDKVKLTWTCYLPPVATGTITIVSIVFANRISAKRMAALAAGYGLLEGRFDEYQDKMKEKFGLKKENDAKDELAQERVDRKPPDSTIIVGEGKVLFQDEPSGRYFESTMEEINRAENTLNRRIAKDESAALTDWYDLIGLAPTGLSEDFGWDISNDPVDVSKRAVITQDGKPCIVLEYNIHPIRNGVKGGGSAKMRAI